MEQIREIISMLGTLAQAQSSLCLLGSSWMFTIAWVFATERRKGGASRLGRALLGLFWLPGLLVYYLLPDVQPESDRPLSPDLRRIPKTRVASRGQTPGPDRVTHDGATDRATRQGACRSADDRITYDGATTPHPTPTSDVETQDREPARYHLRVLNGSLKDQRFPLSTGGSTKIGSANGNAIQLAGDAGVARRHAEIRVRGGTYVLRDRDTSEPHAIFVNDVQVKVKVAQLREGDVMQLGKTRLRFERSR